MRSAFLPDAERYQRSHRRRRVWHRVVTALAAVVVFCTTYALILPAITLENNYICGQEEHRHGESCEQTVQMEQLHTVLSCAPEVHSHTPDCYDGAGQLTCGLADRLLHRHDEGCFNDGGQLICPLEEVSEHIHGERCYQETQELLCGQEETWHEHGDGCFALATGALLCDREATEDHQHTPDCYEQVEPLVCQRPEDPAGHRHTDECRQTVRTLTCPLEQLAVHEHGSECFDGGGALLCSILSAQVHQHTADCRQQVSGGFAEETVLVCGLTEHTHTDICLPAEDPEEPGLTVAPTEDPAQTPADTPTETPTDTPTESPTESPADTPAAAPADTPTEVPGDTPDQPLPDMPDMPDTPEDGETLPAQDTLCGLTEHTHSELCYDALGNLACGAEEHQHTPACAEPPVSDGVQAVIDSIDALPAAEEIGAILTAYEDSGYPEGGEAYFQEMVTRTKAVYEAYQALTAEEQTQVTNADRLLELEWLWGAETLTESFDFSAPTVATSTSTRDFIDLNLYDYSGKINDTYKNNNTYPGFQWNGGAYMRSNTFNRHYVDYIDFGNSNITDIGYGGSGTDIANGRSKNAVIAGNNGGAINELDVSDYGVTNRPIGMSTSGEVLSRTLGSDGYPALADGSSLAYLFTNGGAVTKQNNESIDGLFQKNNTTGAYYYNSRWNHAQYSNDRFTLYNQIITPNFIVYPFGNFLPFNTITDSTRATQVSSINGSSGKTVSDYVQKIVNDMAGSLSGSPTKTQLTDMLKKYKSSIDSAGIKTAQAAIVDYFTAGGSSGDKPSSDTSLIDDDLLSKLYNIDWDEETNFFFGMDMSMNFMQPKDGLTGNDGQQPMVFYFTGDDDVWVYIDGVLFLDLTGIHRHVGGEIDFVNGVVKYYALDTEHGGDVSTTPYKTYNFAELLTAAGRSTDSLNEKGTFKDYTTHSFKFYYMERGSGSSVCRLNFNFPLLRRNSISVTKELTVDDPSKLPLLGDPDFKFQVLRENGTDLFIGGNVSYDIQDTSGAQIGTGKTDANGVFKLKAGQTAVFSSIQENAGKYFVRELLDSSFAGQYGTVSVNGSSVTTNYDVTVGSDRFTGLDSPVKDMSDGSTAFRFDNNVTTGNLGSLSITKTVTDYPQRAKALEQFSFEVKLDDKPLPVGTRYTVGDKIRTVTTAGIITLAPNETATISSILAGTQFTVTETAASAEGYVVSYRVDGGEETSEPASGTVGVGAVIAITVNNAETGATVEIPVTKTLLAPDGRQHTYQFTLTQVTDSTGQTPVENGTTKTLEISVTTEPVAEKFVLDYPLVDLGELPQTFYYQIREAQPENTGTIYDQSVYIVEVTITGESAAQITRIWKDGTLITTEAEVGSVAFTNQIQRYELPQTGGWGVLPCYIAGAALIAAAGLLYRSSKRRRGAGCPH